MSSSSQSYCEQGDCSVLAALSSLQNAAPMSQSSVLALTKLGKTGSLWRHRCSEILCLSDSGATHLCSYASVLHCATNPRELNPKSSSELCRSWNVKPNLNFAASCCCPSSEGISQSQMPKLGKTGLGVATESGSLCPHWHLVSSIHISGFLLVMMSLLKAPLMHGKQVWPSLTWRVLQKFCANPMTDRTLGLI